MTTYVNHPFRCFICTVTLMALLWLTIGFSIANNHPALHSAHHFALKENPNSHDSADIPFENTSDEKAEITSNDLVSEYLKEDVDHLEQFNIGINYYRHYTTRAFVNCCCDSFSPPPETSVC